MTNPNANTAAVRLLEVARGRLVRGEPDPLDVPAVRESLARADGALLSALAQLEEEYANARQHLGAAVAAVYVLPSTTKALVAVETAGVVFPAEDELQATTEQVGALRAELARAQARIRDAAALGNVDDVMTLRQSVAVDLPERLAEAEAQLLELRVDRGEARIAPLRERAAAEESNAQAAAQAVLDAEEALRNAHRHLEDCRRLQQGLQSEQLEAELQGLRARRDTARQQQQDARSARVLQLAGLGGLTDG